MYAERHARPWLLIAGALGDVATLIKQTGVVLLVGIAAWVVVQCVLQRRRDCAGARASEANDAPYARRSTGTTPTEMTGDRDWPELETSQIKGRNLEGVVQTQFQRPL